MDGLQFSTSSSLSGFGGVQRDIRSSAGDGFKSVFQNIIQSSADSRASIESSSDSLSSTFGEGDEGAEFKLPKDLLEKVKEDITPEKLEKLKAVNPELKDTLDKLLNSADKLSTQDVDNIVKEIKTLLKNPETASQVLQVLEKAGVDLTTLNMHDLQKALESLPVEVREQLATLLNPDGKGTANADNVSKALSEALGQLMQEQKHAKKGQTASTTPPADSGEETLDQFLTKSKARVTAAPPAEDGSDPLKLTLRQQAAAENGEGKTVQVSPETLPADTPLPQQTTSTEGLVSVVAPETVLTKVSEALTNAAQNSKGSSDAAINALDPNKMTKVKKDLAEVATPKTHRGTDIEKSNMLKRLMAQAKLHLNDGEGRFQIRLDPPELGNIRLTIDNKEGVLSASIMTETEAARQTLVANIDNLKVALAEQGVNVGELNVSTQDQHGSGGHRQNAFERQMQEHQAKMLVAADRRRDLEDGEVEVDMDWKPEPNINVEV